MKYEPVIGLEIHAELNTKTKMFCYSKNDPDEKHPNVNICPICMGHPGTLPTINKEAVKKVIQVGLALHGKIQEFSQFDRKNYFYPDLPKGYQISQYEHPLVKGGHLDILTHAGVKTIRITRIHLEEDTGRLAHSTNLADQRGQNADVRGSDQRESASSQRESATLVDFNRAGVPLMELVTEPDLRTGEEVRQFGEELQKIIRYVGASDADMEKGQMRVEVNISLRRSTQTYTQINAEDTLRESASGQRESAPLGTKVEIKNINSFKYAADAVDYEIQRQTAALERGEKVVQETRGWNEHKGESFSQRTKESAHDYRYFPEPDLPPLNISREWVENLRAELPELPAAKRERFSREYGLDDDVIEILSRDKELSAYFEQAASELAEHDRETQEKPKKNLARTLGAFVTGDFLRLLRETSAPIREVRIIPENFGELVLYVAENKVSNLAAKQVMEEMFRSGDDPSDIIDRLGLWQMSDTGELEDIASHIIKENPAAVEDYKKGKSQSLQFLVGQIMKESRGTANPKMAQEITKKILDTMS